MAPKEPQPTSIRISDDLLREIDRDHDRREKALGAKISRNAVIAMLIREAVAARSSTDAAVLARSRAVALAAIRPATLAAEFQVSKEEIVEALTLALAPFVARRK